METVEKVPDKDGLASAESVDASGGASPPDESRSVVVIGGGPAGLTGAYELLKLSPSMKPLVVEAGERVGGIARTEEYKGYRFDIGGHRFFTKVKPVEELWHEIMGDAMIDVPRSSRIYYQGRFYDYPLSIGNALGNLGLYESARVALSFAKWKLFPSKEEENFEQWVSNRFGGRLYWHFFRTYTEKVWGISPKEIRADWAAQRIKDLSLTKAVIDSLTGKSDTASLIKTFKYPRLGPGQMWETAADIIEKRGGEVRLQTRADRVYREGNRVVGVDMRTRKGEQYRVACEHLINSMPITELVRCITPAAPDHVLEAANRLKYRDFLIVTLVLDHPDPFADNWIYIHSPEVKVGRIQNFRAWSAAMLPNQNTASIGMEYFCHEGDGLWNSTNQELLELAKQELERLKLAPASSVIDGTVIRQPKAYPVYDADYKENLEVIKEWLLTFENLQSVGRNGMHRYNNQDHSMLAAMLSARNILGESHDIWSVNVERSYHEEFVVDKKKSTRGELTAENRDSIEHDPFSVVLPVHNAGEKLDKAVRAILDSQASPVEIILADDGSSDGAPERVLGFDQRIRVLRVSENAVGPAQARNMGVAAAESDMVVFVDSDVCVQREAIGSLIEPLMREPGVVASFGSYDNNPAYPGIASVYANIRHHYVHQNGTPDASTFWSGLGAVRRDAFLEAGGFDASYTKPSIEDVELGIRLRQRGKVRLVKDAQATHLKRWTLFGLWRTDIKERAIPWGRLAVEHEHFRSALNASRREKISALLVGLMILAILALPVVTSSGKALVAAGIAGLSAAVWVWVNWKLLALLKNRGGVVACVGGAILHVIYYLYGASAYLSSVIWYRWKGWMRSERRSTPSVLGIGLCLFGLLALCLTLLVIGLSSTQALLDWLTKIEGNASNPRYSLESLGAVQARFVAIAAVLLGVTAWLAQLGPAVLIEQCVSGIARLRDVFCLPKTDWIFGILFTMLAAVLGALYLSQQMRLDEASSFAMYATSSPLVPLLTYETPNNHILNSLLMWLSVGVFGPSEWAARLPAYIAALLIPVCMLAAGRKLLSPMIALIGAGLYAGSTIGVDIATNARGYPIATVAMLLLLGLLPALRERKQGATLAAVALGAIGFYACPVMAYPFAVVYSVWLIAGPVKGISILDHVLGIARAAIGTAGVVALLYAPAWAFQSGNSPLETLRRAARGYKGQDSFLRLEELTYNLHAAWSQWTWPAPSLLAILIFVIAIAGVWMWISRAGWPRAIVIGLAFGTVGVYVATGLAPPPWWILVWAVPFLALLLATPIAYLAVLISPKPIMAQIASVGAVGAALMGFQFSAYPTEFPFRLGTKDAPAIVEILSEWDLRATHVVTSPEMYRLLNFEFEKRGYRRGVALPLSSLNAPTREVLTHVRDADDSEQPETDGLTPELADVYRLEESIIVGNSVIDTYRVQSMRTP